MVDKDLEDITRYYNSIPKDIRKNLKIVKADPKFPYMLHGSIDGNIKEFIPRLPERYAKYEDLTVNRIHVSDNVYGCLYGMEELYWYLHDGYYYDVDGVYYENKNDKDNKDYLETEKDLLERYKGGWYIYAIPFRYCLKPIKYNILGDLYLSNEHWLVGYNNSTKKYKGSIVGKLILKGYNKRKLNIKDTVSSYSFLLECNKDGLLLYKNKYDLKIYKELRLSKGFYEFAISRSDLLSEYKNYDELLASREKPPTLKYDKIEFFRKITEEEFYKDKSYLAPNLFYKPSIFSSIFSR